MALQMLRTSGLCLLGLLVVLALSITLGVAEALLDTPGDSADDFAQTDWVARGKPRPPEPAALDLHLSVGVVLLAVSPGLGPASESWDVPTPPATDPPVMRPPPHPSAR